MVNQDTLSLQEVPIHLGNRLVEGGVVAVKKHAGLSVLWPYMYMHDVLFIILFCE